MKVLVDLDGTILDLCSAIKVQLAKKGITFIPENVVSYSFAGNIGCKRKEVFKTFSDVNTYRLQKPYKGAVEALKKLSSVVEVEPYTKIKAQANLFSYRKHQIEEVGMHGNPIIAEKKTVIEGDYVAVFDDCIGVLEEWVDREDVFLFLIDQPYNRNIMYTRLFARRNFFRCKDFNEAVELFIKLQNEGKIKK